MIFFGVLIGSIILGAVAYLAINKKSNFMTRIAALGAIAVMIITVIICIIIVFSDNTVPIDPSTLIVGEVREPETNGGSPIALIFFIFFLIAIFAVIFFLSMREHKRTNKK